MKNNNNIKINNIFYNKRSKKVQEWKLSQPGLNNYLKSIAIGMVISDACLYKIGNYPYIKFEQSKEQYGLIHNLYGLFNNYTFMDEIGIRYKQNSTTIKSFYFKTYSHPTFLEIWDIFYENNMKIIKPNLIDYIDDVALSYWIMGDGSLHKRDKILTLHTENLSLDDNKDLSIKLNNKFKLDSYIGLSNKNNKTYYMIHIPHKNKNIILELTNKYIIPDFKYKINY